jgi:hypothetical protein
MVEISQQATELLTAVRSGEDIPDTYGVRFRSEKAQDGSDAVGIALAQGPVTGDEVVLDQALPVYVAPEVSQEVSNAVLDVEGGPENPQFVIRS